MPCTGLIGIITVDVVHVPSPLGFATIVEPGAGIAIGAGFVGATGVGVPTGGVGGVGFVGPVGFVGSVGPVGLVVPVATFAPPLYVQPFSAAVTTRIRIAVR